MRLLIVTQVVNEQDPVLGFFCRWIEEFSKHVERIEVVCLKEGKHNFYSAKNAVPRSKNSRACSGTGVRVHSLGKERGAACRAAYAWRFLSLAWRLRRNYDAVFVHMNPEYVILGGLFWRLWGKPIALWYTHKSVNLKLRLATLLSNVIFTASKESFRLSSRKVRVMGHGIDTDFFSPDASVVRGDWILSVGRLMRSKRHDLVIRAAALGGRELRIVGEGPERKNLESLAHTLDASVHFLGGLTQTQLRDEYRKAAYLVHASETGSLDKVVLEALATDVAIITTSDAYKGFPVHAVAATSEAITEAFERARENYDKISIIREHHSLQHLVPAILGTIRTI